MNKQQVLEALQKKELFSDISPFHLKKIAKQTKAIILTMGEIVPQSTEFVYLIHEGTARMVGYRQEKPFTIATFSSHDILSNSVSTRASSENLTLFRFPHKEFHHLLELSVVLQKHWEKGKQELETLSFLRQSTFLGTFPLPHSKFLLSHLQLRSFSTSQVLNNELELGKQLHLIYEGVILLKHNELSLELGKGTCLGEHEKALSTSPETSLAAKNHVKILSLETKYLEPGKLPPEQRSLPDTTQQRIVQPSLQVTQPILSPPKKKISKRKKTSSWSKYPWVRQYDSSDCAAACLAMISRYHGVNFPMARLREWANVGPQGTSMYYLARAAEKIGYVARGVNISQDLLPTIELPGIVHWKHNHYVVLYKITEQGVVIGDPARGIVKMKLEEFLEAWTERMLILSLSEELQEPEETSTSIKRFFRMLKPYKYLLIEVFLASLILEILGLSSPIFIQFIVDKVIVHSDVRMLNIMLAGMIILGVFQTITGVLRHYLLIHISTKLDLKMTADLFQKIIQLPLSYFQSRKIGDILTRFADRNKVRSFITGATITTLLDSIMAVVYISLMFFYSFKLTLLVLCFVSLFIILTLVFTPLLKRNNQRLFEKIAFSQSHLIESIKSIQAVKSAAAELETRWKYEELVVQNANVALYGAKLNLAMGGISSKLNLLFSAVMLWFGAHLVIGREMTVGQLMAFQSLVGMTMLPVMGLVGMWQVVQDTLLSLERLSDIYDTEPEQDPKKHWIKLPQMEGNIEFKNVSFRHNENDKNILCNVSFQIHAGQTVALVGRSGSGKTTLLNLLQGFYSPSEGQILIDSYDVAQLDKQSLRSQMGVVLQENSIFSNTIRDNISLYNPQASLDNIIQAAKLANAHDFIMSFPLGYDTRVGEAGIKISGGQEQRIAIARAMLIDPPLLIFDEATSALDTQSEQIIHSSLKEITHKRTVLIIAHRISTVRKADLILVLNKGMISEQGSHEDLLAKKGLYYHLNNQQIEL